MRNLTHGATPPPRRATNDPASRPTGTAPRAKSAASDAGVIIQRVLDRIRVIIIVIGVFFVVIGALIALG